MKAKFLVLLGFLFVTAISVNAQGGGQAGQRRMGTPEERMKMFTEKVIPELKLTKEKQTKLEAIYLDYYKAQDKLRAGLQGGERPDRTVFQKMMTERDEKVKAVLSEDEQKKLKEVEASMRPQRAGGPGGQAGGPAQPQKQ